YYKPLFVDINVTHTVEGIELLKKHNAIDKPFLTMEFSSFIQNALSVVPVGGSPFMDVNITITRTVCPPVEKFFSNAQYVLLLRANRPHLQEFFRICYGDYLAKHYTLIDDSPAWYFYERKPEETTIPAALTK
ncbi:hypothetical protein FGG08_007617, partial [Glutinoglossum americanum]